jgi:hypothetical protein
MHRISRRMVAVVVVIGALAAGGAAFTASNTVQASTAGYGTQITTALITFTGDLSSDTVQAGFGSDALTTCSAPVYDGTTSSTTTCSGFTQNTASSATFNVAVTNN